MNKGKGSKNSIENRGTKSVMTCATCGQGRQPIRVMAMGSKTMGYECGCGLLTRAGEKIAL